MGCFSSKPTADPPPVATRGVLSLEQSPQVVPPVTEVLPRPSSRQSGTRSRHVSTQGGGEPSPGRRPPRARAHSNPQRVPSMKDIELLPLPLPRTRAKSSAAPSSRGGPSLEHRQASAEHSRPSPRRPAMSYPARRPLNSTMRQVLPEHFKFRILVVGKSGSGKSSLIKAVFKVDVAAAPERAPGKADINVEFRPEDNGYLIVHEYSGLGSQGSDSQDFQTIRDFISHRTDPSRSLSERLHAVWICVPASDAIDGRLGEGVEEILGLKNVPVVVVLTKFDAVVSRVLFDIAGGNTQHHERARARAYTMYEESCRRLFRKDPRDVPVEIVSGNPRFIDLIESLVVTTDRFITDTRAPSTRAGVPGEKQRVGAVPLAWSAALRVNHDTIIQASIEVGRSRYWRSLWSSLDFADQTLKNCLNVIHVDIVEIWNLNDRGRYLLSDKFKARMSHLVKDLTGFTNSKSGSDRTRAGDEYSDWVQGVYRGSQENVRCVVGYIVDLTVILDGIFRVAAGDMSQSHAMQVLEEHIRSGHRDAIHHNIRRFISEAFARRFTVPHRDLVLDTIVDLIKQFCAPPSGDSSYFV